MSLSPFRQMQSAFDRDCIEAQKMLIVGYSFGDAHLNESIRVALIHNPEINIEIVDPNFREGKMDWRVYNEVFSSSARSMAPKNLTPNSCSFLDGKVLVHEEHFEQFLKEWFLDK